MLIEILLNSFGTKYIGCEVCFIFRFIKGGVECDLDWLLRCLVLLLGHNEAADVPEFGVPESLRLVQLLRHNHVARNVIGTVDVRVGIFVNNG